MEKDNTKQEEGKPQKIYFNDKGKLIVESNKGVWVDGTQYVKMYGIFTCNAKTLGEIIHRISNIPVEIGIEENIVHTTQVVKDAWGVEDQQIIQHYCVLGVNEERVREYEKSLAEKKYTNEEIESLVSENNKASDEVLALKRKIERYNKLPWWKRMFKKVKVK